MKGLLIAALAALGTILAGMIKADLEDEEVCRWLARKLVYRATECLPADERDRWREELVRDLLDLKGRLAPLWWALSTWLQAGRWGRERGVPSRWETLAIRARLTWERLRSLTAKRARARSMQRHPSVQVQADTAQAMGVAFNARVLTVNPLTITGGADQQSSSPDSPFWSPARERLAFEADLDRKIEEYRRRIAKELGL